MFTPDPFKAETTEALEIIRAAPFAALVSVHQNQPLITHLPLSLSADGRSLSGHMAKANDHWQYLQNTMPVTAIFQHGDHYISPNWYPSKAATGKAVPTWNYVAVHVAGPITLLHEAAEKKQLLEILTQEMEAHRPDPWTLESAPPEYINRLLNGIVGLRLDITSVQGKFKLSQNKSEPDKAGIRSGLQEEATERAREMAKRI